MLTLNLLDVNLDSSGTYYGRKEFEKEWSNEKSAALKLEISVQVPLFMPY